MNMPDLSYYLDRGTPLKEAKQKVAEDTFGVGFKRDRNGNPIEEGLGSLKQPTQQSIDAYIKEQTTRRMGGPEPDFEKHLETMRQRLRDYQAKKAAHAGDAA